MALPAVRDGVVASIQADDSSAAGRQLPLEPDPRKRQARLRQARLWVRAMETVAVVLIMRWSGPPASG